MILVEITINGTMHRISTEDLALEHFWTGFIKSFPSIRYALRHQEGGYVEPVFGSFSLSPDLFADDMPPPKKCVVTVMVSEENEATAQDFFTGNVYRNGLDDTDFNYDFYGDQFTASLAAETIIDDALDAVFTAYCGASYLNLTLVDTYKRTVQPDVYGVFPAGTLVIDMLDLLAQSANHFFKIAGANLHLVDMLKDNGSAMEIEQDGEPYRASYTDAPLYTSFASAAVKEYAVDGSDAGVGKVYRTSSARYLEHLYGRVGDNSGNDEANLIHSLMLPYETGKYYKMVVKYRRVSGSGVINAGFAGVASDRTTWVNTVGNNFTTNQHKFVISSGASSGWETKTGYASGWAATGDSTEKPTVGSPAVMQTNVAYVRPWIYCYTASGIGEFDIDFVAIYEVDASGNELARLFYDDFTAGFSGEWVRYSGSGERETYTSEAESVTNVEAGLTNVKTILESPSGKITVPFILSRIPEHGQPVTWVDARIGPQGTSLTAEIRARSVTIDVDNHQIIVEGEGALT